MAIAENLFVYGTLRRGFSNEFASLLNASAQLIGEGSVNGRLYQVAHYPGLLLSSDPEEWVRGEVYRLESPEPIYAELDAYEGCGPTDPPPHEFRRETVSVRMDSATTIHASTYIYCWSVDENRRIVSGEYLPLTGAAGDLF